MLFITMVPFLLPIWPVAEQRVLEDGIEPTDALPSSGASDQLAVEDGRPGQDDGLKNADAETTERSTLIISCRGGDALACSSLGKMHEQDTSDSTDYRQARHYYLLACTGLDAESCFHLGSLYERGLGGEQDLNESRTLYQEACELGVKAACVRLKYVSESEGREQVKFAFRSPFRGPSEKAKKGPVDSEERRIEVIRSWRKNPNVPPISYANTETEDVKRGGNRAEVAAKAAYRGLSGLEVSLNFSRNPVYFETRNDEGESLFRIKVAVNADYLEIPIDAGLVVFAGYGKVSQTAQVGSVDKALYLPRFGLRLQETGSHKELFLDIFDEENALKSGGGIPLGRGWRIIEVEWVAGITNAGYALVWMDGELRCAFDGFSNSESRIDAFRLGVLQVLGEDISGSIYFDEFASFRSKRKGLRPITSR